MFRRTDAHQPELPSSPPTRRACLLREWLRGATTPYPSRSRRLANGNGGDSMQGKAGLPMPTFLANKARHHRLAFPCSLCFRPWKVACSRSFTIAFQASCPPTTWRNRRLLLLPLQAPDAINWRLLIFKITLPNSSA